MVRGDGDGERPTIRTGKVTWNVFCVCLYSIVGAHSTVLAERILKLERNKNTNDGQVQLKLNEIILSRSGEWFIETKSHVCICTRINIK